jgi:hypothetical protein
LHYGREPRLVGRHKTYGLPFEILAIYGFTTVKLMMLMVVLMKIGAYGGTEPAGLNPLFCKKAAVVLAPKLSVIFRRLIRNG